MVVFVVEENMTKATNQTYLDLLQTSRCLWFNHYSFFSTFQVQEKERKKLGCSTSLSGV
jgi:hypothetical protein